MSVFWLSLIVFGIAAAGYVLGRKRALTSAGGQARNLHSLPSYYGFNVFLSACIPAFGVMLVWLLLAPVVIDKAATSQVPESLIVSDTDLTLIMSDVRRVSHGLDTLVSTGVMSAQNADDLSTTTTDVRKVLAESGVALGADVKPEILAAAQRYRTLAARSGLAMTVLVLALAGSGAAFAYQRTSSVFRARIVVEQVIKGVLIFASLIAILTTVGIILSLLFETRNFFGQYSWTNFFFGTTWAPNFRGNSDLGILPLLWGTLYVSTIALIVAVPIGLFAAIYLSEYASPTIRSVAKPLLEVLAGIPTIVYGLFALITVGPLLRDYFAQPLGLGESGSSVMTAGLVMGIMLIPFVSSLSDDIINAVPQSLRDGSYGLGATKSETIKQVVVPAALPGIVGAILLAASRAIGETMIVVMGAGAAARLSMNPFEAMTTVTVKIVSQLTGDTDFASPETLVAFALGITLFVITLGLNVLALYIVRKYREQYE